MLENSKLTFITAVLTLGVLATGTMTSCSKVSRHAGKTGTLSIAVSNESEIADITKSQVTDYTALPSVDDFTLTITGNRGQIYNGPVSQWDSSTQVQIGDYTAAVLYGSPQQEGPGKAYFSGSGKFSVAGDEHTTVNISAKLGSAIICFEATEQFLRYFPDYNFTVTTGAQNSFTFDPAHTEPLFVDAYKITLSGSMTNQAGAQTTFGPRDYDNLQAATCYTLRFDASNIGGAHVQISFNDTLTTVDLGEIELN